MKQAMFRLLCAAGLALVTAPLAAQTPVDGQAVVDARTAAFFRALQREDPSVEYPFLAKDLAAQISPGDWQALRRQSIAATGGVAAYVGWKTTFYMQGKLLAAVDFQGQGKAPETRVCGYVLWEFSDEGMPMVLRLEENVVPLAAMQAMPVQQAAQTMADFHCPKSLIASVLGVKVN